VAPAGGKTRVAGSRESRLLGGVGLEDIIAGPRRYCNSIMMSVRMLRYQALPLKFRRIEGVAQVRLNDGDRLPVTSGKV